MMRFAVLLSLLTVLTACTGNQTQLQTPAPASEPEPRSGVTFSGYARVGVVHEG